MRSKEKTNYEKTCKSSPFNTNFSIIYLRTFSFHSFKLMHRLLKSQVQIPSLTPPTNIKSFRCTIIFCALKKISSWINFQLAVKFKTQPMGLSMLTARKLSRKSKKASWSMCPVEHIRPKTNISSSISVKVSLFTLEFHSLKFPGLTNQAVIILWVKKL